MCKFFGGKIGLPRPSPPKVIPPEPADHRLHLSLCAGLHVTTRSVVDGHPRSEGDLCGVGTKSPKEACNAPLGERGWGFARRRNKSNNRLRCAGYGAQRPVWQGALFSMRVIHVPVGLMRSGSSVPCPAKRQVHLALSNRRHRSLFASRQAAVLILRHPRHAPDL
jgi:hypothetical protein